MHSGVTRREIVYRDNRVFLLTVHKMHWLSALIIVSNDDNAATAFIYSPFERENAPFDGSEYSLENKSTNSMIVSNVCLHKIE